MAVGKRAVCVESLEPRTLYSATASSPLQVAFDSNGLSKIVYNGVVLLDGVAHPDDRLQVTLENPTAPGPYRWGHTTAWNAASQTLTETFGWGVASVRYTVAANAIQATVHVLNTSVTDTVPGVNVLLAALRFPKAPTGLARGPSTVFLGPQVVPGDFGAGTVALANDDVAGKPLYIIAGAVDAEDTAANRYSFFAESTAQPYQPTSWPVYQRPIAPGASDTYHISFRFGASGATEPDLAPDVYQKYAAAYPSTMNWTDRRPIGATWLSNTYGPAHSATNPRGWFSDPTVDVTTPAGLAAFRARLLSTADHGIATVKAMNGQGAILWDVEGSQYVDCSYVGDPRVATTLAPELDYQGAIDAYFKKFTDAGLRVGVCVRAQQFQFYNGKPAILPAANLQQMLLDKIGYAYKRWGATMFYIDSIDWWAAPPVLAAIHQAFPDVLLVPEFTPTAGLASAGRYAEVRMGYDKTPATDRSVYPNAFSVINAYDGNMTNADQAALVKGVKHGDVLMFHAMAAEPRDQVIQGIYNTALGPSWASVAQGPSHPATPPPAAKAAAPAAKPSVFAAGPMAKKARSSGSVRCGVWAALSDADDAAAA